MLRQARMARLAGIILFSASLASAAAQTQDRGRSIVRLSYIPGNFALPVLVGIEHGLFAREGLSISPIPVTDEGTILRSLGSGGSDFAIGSQTILLSLAESKVGAKVVAVAGYGREMEVIVPVWDTATKSLADLKGKTILLLNGIHNFDAVPELYRALALSKPPMRISDVNIHFIDLANVKQVLDPRFRQTYTQRKIAGLFMFREYTSSHVDDKTARVVISNDDLTKLIGRRAAQPVFASKITLERDPKTVDRFVRAWARTLQHMSDPANKDAVVRVLQIYYLRQYGFPLKKELAETYFGAMKFDRVAWTKEDLTEIEINAKAISAARNILFASIKDPEQRPFKAPPPVADFVDMTYVEKALADLKTEREDAARKAAEKPAEKPAEQPATPAPPPPKN